MADGINIVANFNIDDMIRQATDEVEAVIEDIILALEMACRDTIVAARSLPSPPAAMRGKPHRPNYIDDTGYLRGSIGFAIYNNGSTVTEDFTGTESGNAGQKAAQGQATGRALAKEIAGRFSEGIVAVVVCGAEYAAAVEANGYDVLTGSAKELGNIFKTYIAEVKAVHGL